MQQQDDLRYYLGIVRRRYPYFLLAFLLVFLSALVAAVSIRPIFRSEAKILVESQQIPSELVKSTVTGFADERIAVTRQRITSRDALIEIADKYELFAERRNDLSSSDLVELIRERILILPFDLALTGRRAREGLTTVAFTVGFEYERPEVAAKVANELVTLILNEDIRNRTNKASETTQFLERESNRLRLELGKLDEVLSQFKKDNYDALPERVPFQVASLQRAESNLKDIEREIGNLTENKRLLGVEMSLRRAAQSSGVIGSGDSPQRQIDILKTELAQKLAVYSEKHPEIKALRNQINAIEEQSEAALSVAEEDKELSQAEKDRLDLSSRIISEKMETLDRQIAGYTLQKDAAVKIVSAVNVILSKAPEVQNKLGQMERQILGLQKSLDEISGKLGTARLGEQLERDRQAERFEVIEQPITPQEPVWPDRRKLVAAGAGLAGVAGAAAVVILELLNQSVRASADIVRSFGRHPIAVIPFIGTRKEGKRKIIKLAIFGIGIIAIVSLLLAAINFYFMPLDLLAIKVLSRLGL
jgi:uncharacterized protein involved in exopolysaccharide biosynthesis